MSASEQDPLPIDPADLRVGDVLKQYPAGKLVGLVVAIFLFGGGLAFSFQEWRYSWELRALRDSASVREKYLEKALSTGESTEQRRVFLRFLRDVEEE